jgi:hypothetical protein
MIFRDLIQDGIIDTATWLIITKEDYETIDNALNSVKTMKSPPDKKTLDAVLAVRHETIHFLHSISTSFLFSYSCNYLHACIDVIKLIRNDKIDLEKIPHSGYQGFLGELRQTMLSSDVEGKIRTIDIIEGAAVLCSYRGLLQGQHLDFLKHLQEYHQNQKQYTNAYLYLTDLIGELAFTLFSPICYVSLQGDNPGQNFVLISRNVVKALNDFSIEEIVYDPLTFVLEVSDMSEEGCFPNVVKNIKREGLFTHPILDPYIERIIIEEKIRLADFFARPYVYEQVKTNEFDDFIMDIVPPVHLYSDRKMKLMGLATKLGKDYGVALHHMTSMIGMIPKLLYSKNSKMFCPHTICPVHSTNLCNKYYVFPSDDYTKCAFPTILTETKLGFLIQQS